MDVCKDEHCQYTTIILKKTGTIFFPIKYYTILNCEISKHLVEIRNVHIIYYTMFI